MPMDNAKVVSINAILDDLVEGTKWVNPHNTLLARNKGKANIDVPFYSYISNTTEQVYIVLTPISLYHSVWIFNVALWPWLLWDTFVGEEIWDMTNGSKLPLWIKQSYVRVTWYWGFSLFLECFVTFPLLNKRGINLLQVRTNCPLHTCIEHQPLIGNTLLPNQFKRWGTLPHKINVVL